VELPARGARRPFGESGLRGRRHSPFARLRLSPAQAVSSDPADLAFPAFQPGSPGKKVCGVSAPANASPFAGAAWRHRSDQGIPVEPTSRLVCRLRRITARPKPARFIHTGQAVFSTVNTRRVSSAFRSLR
jgi:hypothetical protein